MNSLSFAPPPSGGSWSRRLTGLPAAGIVLLAFWLFMVASLINKSPTADEPGDMVSGYTYWRFNDYRINPEHGNLPLRFMALPLLFGNYRSPSTGDESWINSDQGNLSYGWFYDMNNDSTGMLFRSRAISGLLAVVLGLLVWLWARQLFGPVGGMLSLLLYALNPSVLANGALATTDMACSMFFLAATWSLWIVLHHLSLRRVLLGALVMAGLFLSKLSAVLMVPVALILVAARLISGQPLPVKCGGMWKLERRSRQAMAFAATAAIYVLVIVIVIWGFYGFRFSMFAHATPGRDRPAHSWEALLGKPSPFELLDKLDLSPEQRAGIDGIFKARGVDPLKVTDGYAQMDLFQVIKQTVLTPGQARDFDLMKSAPPPALGARIIEFVHREKLLPEAYIYGYANVWKNSQARYAFFNGKTGVYGWKLFFPYTFLVKTPLSVFVVMALAAVAARWRAGSKRLSGQASRTLYEALPLWALLTVYWVVLISSHVDIGNRYILPAYAPLFVLCGAAAWWLGWQPEPVAGSRTVMGPGKAGRLAGLVLCASMLALAAEIFYRFPNYLAYFNGILSPSRAYRHLVDSSLDWGQDLPALKQYIEKHQLKGPVYLSYFGVGSPVYYKVPATCIPGYPGQDVPDPLLIFQLPADAADAKLVDRLKKQPDYDVMGRGRLGNGKVFFILLKKPEAFRWNGGTYFISATMLQPVTGFPFGFWDESHEVSYQHYCQLVKPLLGGNEKFRLAALQERPLAKWQEILRAFEALRFARLAAYLRSRDPDDNVNYSILVYKLGDAEIARALDGPPPGAGPDLPVLIDN